MSDEPAAQPGLNQTGLNQTGRTPVNMAMIAVLSVGAIAGGTFFGVKLFERGVHDYIVNHPEVLLEAEEAYAKKQNDHVIANARAVIRAHQSEIFADPRDPFVGPQNAKVTVVQFFDYRCPHCKAEAAPAVLALIRKYPDVKFVFKEWPIFGAPSQAAATAALGAAKQGKYLPVFAAMMAERELDQTSVDRILREQGVDVAQAEAFAASPAAARQLSDVQRLALLLNAGGTPAFIVGDTMVTGARMDDVEALIQKGRKG
jgi:protein-disulfide isomerase